jgi:hypothetical protein
LNQEKLFDYKKIYIKIVGLSLTAFRLKKPKFSCRASFGFSTATGLSKQQFLLCYELDCCTLKNRSYSPLLCTPIQEALKGQSGEV